MLKRLRFAHCLLPALALLSTLCAAADASIIRVKWDSSTNGPGNTWAKAYHTVTAAIAASVAGDEIWVAGDSAHPYERIRLKDGVGLYGGFAGTETARDDRDWNTNVTILDNGGSGMLGSVVTTPSGATASTILDGFTVRSGAYGINCTSSSPSITNNTISGNGGYGIYCHFSSPSITNNTISGNGWDGIYCTSSSPSIANNTISGNGDNGIGCEDASPAIANNTVSGNGIDGIDCSYSSSPSITNNTVSGNGYGISCNSSSPSITNNTISGNRYSGISCQNSSSPSITNNTISGNGACGICCQYSSPSITNNIVAFNARGIGKYGTSGAPVLWNNCLYNPDGTDYSGLSAGIADISADPKFQSAAYGKLHVQPYSPCVDAGLDSAVGSGWKDMDGQPRIQGEHVDIGADESDGTLWPEHVPVVVRVSVGGVDDAAHDGSSWALAKRTVQAGVDAASVAGGEVWVAAGTYAEHVTLPPYAYLYGGFAGVETSRGGRNWAVNKCILDGGGTGVVVTAWGGYRVNALDGFTVRNGGSVWYDAGIYCSNSSPSITNNTISGNNGRGIQSLSGSSPSITNNTISGNGQYGIYCSNSSPSITNNTISANGWYGIHCVDVSAPSITNNTISANGRYGISCVYSSSPSITNNTISANGWYGIVCSVYSSPSITNNTISGSGDGISCISSSPSITNNTISGNWYGIYCEYSSPSITNTIVAFNATGIYKYDTSGAPVLRNNCVFNPDGTNYDGLSAGTGDINEDSLLVDRAGGDFHLSQMSPCINAGLDSAVGDGWLDLDGQPRVLGAHVDIGADEFQATNVAAARAAVAGAPVALPAMPVTALWPDVFYLEQPDRACGIRVEKPGHGLVQGQTASVAGQVVLASNGEVSVLAESVAAEGTGGVEPVIVRNMSLGGAGNGLQPAIFGSLGLNNIGLLVTTAGTVSAPRVQSGWFYVDDGSGASDGTGIGGIYVDATGLLAPPAGSFAAVTGISSCEWYEGDLVNVLRPRSQADILVTGTGPAMSWSALELTANPRSVSR